MTEQGDVQLSDVLPATLAGRDAVKQVNGRIA
jgi:hypothetical protein